MKSFKTVVLTVAAFAAFSVAFVAFGVWFLEAIVEPLMS